MFVYLLQCNATLHWAWRVGRYRTRTSRQALRSMTETWDLSTEGRILIVFSIFTLFLVNWFYGMYRYLKISGNFASLEIQILLWNKVFVYYLFSRNNKIWHSSQLISETIEDWLSWHRIPDLKSLNS